MLRASLPASPAARRILVGTLFSAIGRGLTLPYLFIYLTQVRGLSPAVAGLLVGWMGAVSLLLAPLGGTLVDRFGARRVVLPLFLVAAAGSASLAFVTGPLSAFAALTAIAVAFAALWAGQQTILASLVTPEESQRAFGLSFTLLNLGIGVGGMIASLVVQVARPATFQMIYFGDAASYLIPAGILLSMPTVGRRLAARPEPLTTSTVEGKIKAKEGYAQILRDRPFMRLIIFGLILTTCGYAQIEVGFTAFSTLVAGVEPRVIGWALAGNTLTIVVAQLFIVRWLEGRSRTRALAVVGVVFALAWLVLGGAGLAGRAGLTVLAMIGVIACAVIFATGETFLSPVMPSLTNALATDELRGRYNAMGSMIWGVSGIVGPVSAGPLLGAGQAGLWVTMVVGGSLIASLIALSLRSRLTPEQDGRLPAAAPHLTRPATPQPATELTPG